MNGTQSLLYCVSCEHTGFLAVCVFMCGDSIRPHYSRETICGILLGGGWWVCVGVGGWCSCALLCTADIYVDEIGRQSEDMTHESVHPLWHKAHLSHAYKYKLDEMRNASANPKRAPFAEKSSRQSGEAARGAQAVLLRISFETPVELLPSIIQGASAVVDGCGAKRDDDIEPLTSSSSSSKAIVSATAAAAAAYDPHTKLNEYASITTPEHRQPTK